MLIKITCKAVLEIGIQKYIGYKGYEFIQMKEIEQFTKYLANKTQTRKT